MSLRDQSRYLTSNFWRSVKGKGKLWIDPQAPNRGAVTLEVAYELQVSRGRRKWPGTMGKPRTVAPVTVQEEQS